MATRYPRRTKREPGVKSEPKIKTEPGIKSEPGVQQVKLEPGSTPSTARDEPPQTRRSVKAEDVGMCSTFCAPAKLARGASKNDPTTKKRARRASKNDLKAEGTVAVKLETQSKAPLPAWANYKEPLVERTQGDEPYPKMKGPSPQECASAVAAMADVYGLPSAKRPVPMQRPDLLDSLVGTILSQNTTDVNSRRAFKSLKDALPAWRDVLDADPAVMIEAIRSGGAWRSRETQCPRVNLTSRRDAWLILARQDWRKSRLGACSLSFRRWWKKAI